MPARATTSAQADAFVALLDHLGIDRVTVLGFSAGTTPALRTALQHPDRVAALAIASGHYPQKHYHLPGAVFRPLYTDAFFWLLNRFAPRALWNFAAGLPKAMVLSESDQSTVRTIVDSLFPISPKRVGATFGTVVVNPDVDNVPLEEIAVPTLLVHAADDQLATYAAAGPAAARIPHAKLITIPRGAHLLLGAESHVRQELSEFVRSHSAAKRATR
jgi:pimeloyl-ACP methyl ester carboxylesterase